MKPPLINSGITSALHSNEWDWIVAYGLILTGKTDMAFLRRHTRVNFPKFMHRCRKCGKNTIHYARPVSIGTAAKSPGVKTSRRTCATSSTGCSGHGTGRSWPIN